MTQTTFDTAFAQLLQAFNRHEELRASKAGIPALARSSQELFKARMQMRQHAAR